MTKKIILIIPAYNEGRNIKKILTDIRRLELPLKKKVILVDDGSSDATLESARSFQNVLDLKLIVHKKNEGIPRTFYDGLCAAAKVASPEDVITIIEGDNTSDLTLLSRMIEMIERGSDIVVASRYLRGGKYKNFPFRRKYGSIFINNFLRVFFYMKGITDYTIFYRSYRADIIQKALKLYKENFITTKSFAANLEILLKVKKFTKKCSEVPMVYDYGLKKGKSKMNVTKALLEYKDLVIQRLKGKI